MNASLKGDIYTIKLNSSMHTLIMLLAWTRPDRIVSRGLGKLLAGLSHKMLGSTQEVGQVRDCSQWTVWL